MVTVGTKVQVWHGQADKTRGGLTKKDLMISKRGKIISKKKHQMGLQRYKENKAKLREPFGSKKTAPKLDAIKLRLIEEIPR